MKNKKRIYDRHELLDLVNKEHSCIILKHCNRKLELQAKYLKDVKTGIKEALDTCLNKFDYSLNGILLDYRHLKVLVDEWSGRIVGRFGEFLVTISADFFVFDPKIGSLLEGVVNAKSSTHVGCLVHKRFNAMILKPDIEDHWNCENIQIGDKIIFTIVDHVFSTNIPHIEGVLATEYIDKSPKSRKKKSKVSGIQTEDFCKSSDENTTFAQDNNKIVNKIDEVDSSVLNFKNPENDLTDDLGNKSPKPKSKKRKIDAVSLHDDESLVEVKKKKKKEKEKSERILETEKLKETDSINLTSAGNPPSVFPETIDPMNNSESSYIKRKKKKRDKEKELDNSELIIERKKKKKKDKRKNSESNESACLETMEKKECEDLKEIEESLRKSRKKKKREKENSSSDFVKTVDQIELSQSNKNRLCVDRNSEVNVSPVDLIDQLMKVVPTDLILPTEATPIKGTSLEILKSPTLSSPKKTKTPEKSRSPNKKNREGSLKEGTHTMAINVQDSPSKRRHLEESLKSPKSARPLDKSLFSDSEASAQSPLKPLRDPIVLDVRSSETKLGETDGKADGDELPITSTQPVLNKQNSIDKKEKKQKKSEDRLTQVENKSKRKTGTVKAKEKSVSSIIKSTLEKNLEKKDSGNKSVTWESENVLSPVSEPKTTLLQRFEKCLGNDELKLISKFSNKSPTTPSKKETNIISEGLAEVKEKKSIGEPLAIEEKITKEDARKGENKSKDNTGLDLTEETVQSQRFSLGGVDVTQWENPVKTSTPKAALNNSDISGGKVKKPRTKKVKKSDSNVNDEERASMISNLLQLAKQRLGL